MAVIVQMRNQLMNSLPVDDARMPNQKIPEMSSIEYM